MTNDQPQNIVALEPHLAAEAAAQDHTSTRTLSVTVVAELCAKAARLRELAASRIRTPAMDAEQQALAQDLGTYTLAHCGTLLETWLVMFTEYRPLLIALQPIVARIGTFQIKPPKAPPIAEPNARVDGSVNSEPIAE